MTLKELETYLRCGGVTLDSFGKVIEPQVGYAVCLANSAMKIDKKTPITEIRKMIHTYSLWKDCYLGIYVNQNGIWITSNKIIEDKEEAIRLGMEQKQDSIWDFHNHTEYILKKKEA